MYGLTRRENTVEDLFAPFLRDAMRGFFGGVGEIERAYRANASVKEDEKSYHVTLELPGVEKKDVSVELVEGTLVVAAERKKDDIKEGECEHHDDFLYGKRINRISFPKEVDAEKVEATFKNGLLSITIPKKEEVKPKPVEIKVK